MTHTRSDAPPLIETVNSGSSFLSQLSRYRNLVVPASVPALPALTGNLYDVAGPPEATLRVAQAFSLLLQRAVSLPAFRLLYRDYKRGKGMSHGINEGRQRPAPVVIAVDLSRARGTCHRLKKVRSSPVGSLIP